MMVKWSELTPRERDALVAEKVMGWRHVGPIDETGRDYFETTWDASCVGGSQKAKISISTRFLPSTSIADAWEVVEKIASDRRYFPEMHVLVADNALQHHCDIWYNDPQEPMSCKWLVRDVYALTAPEAICIAALRAVGVEVEA